jgi:hypothetical protein
MSGITHKIESLAKIEVAAAEQFDERYNAQYGMESYDVRAAAKEILRLQRTGEFLPGADSFGTFPMPRSKNEQHFSLLSMLLFQPRLIVDFPSISKDDFTRTFSVSPSQFTILAQKHFLLPNLYEYESQSKLDIPFAGYAAHPYLEDIIDPDSGANTRINSIRRNALLAKFFPQPSTSFARGYEVFKEALDFAHQKGTIGSDYLAYKLRSPSVDVAATRLAAHWVYVNQFGTSEALKLLHKIEVLAKHNVDAAIASLSSLKTIFASPVTAAFGGTLNINLQDYDTHGEFVGLKSELPVHQLNMLSEPMRGFSEYINVVLRGEMNAQESGSVPNLRNLSDDDFADFVRCLEDNAPILNDAESIHRTISRSASIHEKLTSYEAYKRRIDEWRRKTTKEPRSIQKIIEKHTGIGAAIRGAGIYIDAKGYKSGPLLAAAYARYIIFWARDAIIPKINSAKDDPVGAIGSAIEEIEGDLFLQSGDLGPDIRRIVDWDNKLRGGPN